MATKVRQRAATKTTSPTAATRSKRVTSKSTGVGTAAPKARPAGKTTVRAKAGRASAATAAASPRTPARGKSAKTAKKSASPSVVSQAVTAVGDAVPAAVEAVKSLAHKGEELVGKMFGSRTKSSKRSASSGGRKK